MFQMKAAVGSGLAVALLGVALLAGSAQGGSGNELDAATDSPIAAFTQERSDIDRPPSNATSELAATGLAKSDVERSIRAQSRDGWTLYLTPSADGVCLALADPLGGATVSCQNNDALSTGDARPASVLMGCKATSPQDTPTCDEALLYGAVADGVHTVRVGNGANTVAQTAVIDNSYILSVPLKASPDVLQMETGNRTLAQPLELEGASAGQ
jgi:hypothetical protein